MGYTRKITIEVEVKHLSDENLKVGDYVDHKNKIYIFKGYEYGTYPTLEDAETGEEIQPQHY